VTTFPSRLPSWISSGFDFTQSLPVFGTFPFFLLGAILRADSVCIEDPAGMSA